MTGIPTCTSLTTWKQTSFTTTTAMGRLRKPLISPEQGMMKTASPAVVWEMHSVITITTVIWISSSAMPLDCPHFSIKMKMLRFLPTSLLSQELER